MFKLLVQGYNNEKDVYEKNTYTCTNYRDALKYLAGSRFELIKWVEYDEDGFEIR